MKRLFIMRVIRHDGEVMGTGWIGKCIDASLSSDPPKLIRALRRLGAIPPRVRVTIESGGNELCIVYQNDIQLVLRDS